MIKWTAWWALLNWKNRRVGDENSKAMLWKKPKTTKSTNPEKTATPRLLWMLNCEYWLNCSTAAALSMLTALRLPVHTSFIYICRPLLLAERKQPEFGPAYSKRTVSRWQSIHKVVFTVCVNCWRGSAVDAIYLQGTGNSDWASESAFTSDSSFLKQFRDKVIKQTPAGSICLLDFSQAALWYCTWGDA